MAPLLDTYAKTGQAFVDLALQVMELGAADFAAKSKSSAPKQCQKGYACKAACISKGLQCRVPLKGQAKTYAGWLKLQVAAGAKLSQSQQQDAEALGLAKSNPPNPPAIKKKSIENQVTPSQVAAITEWHTACIEIAKQTDIPDKVKKRAFADKKLAAAAQDSAVSLPDSYRALVDKKGVTQAIARISTIKEKGEYYLMIDSLSLAPWNVTGGDPRTVKNAGEELVKSLVKESEKRGFDGRVGLTWIEEDRVDFYKGLGFKGNSTSMVLTSDGAKKLLYGIEPPPPPQKPAPKSVKDTFPPADKFVEAIAGAQSIGTYTYNQGGIYKATIDGEEYFIKKPKEPKSAATEETVYQLAKTFGMEDDVVPAKMVEINGEPHAVSPFLKLEPFTKGPGTIKPEIYDREQALKYATFDYITGNVDRHLGNVAYSDGKLRLIDNEFSLGNRNGPQMRFGYKTLMFNGLLRQVEEQDQQQSSSLDATPRHINKEVAQRAIDSLDDTIAMLDSKGLSSSGYKKRINLLKEVLGSDNPTFESLIERMDYDDYTF